LQPRVDNRPDLLNVPGEPVGNRLHPGRRHPLGKSLEHFAEHRCSREAGLGEPNGRSEHLGGRLRGGARLPRTLGDRPHEPFVDAGVHAATEDLGDGRRRLSQDRG